MWGLDPMGQDPEDDGLNAARGILWAFVLVIPFWATVAVVAVWL